MSFCMPRVGRSSPCNARYRRCTCVPLLAQSPIKLHGKPRLSRCCMSQGRALKEVPPAERHACARLALIVLTMVFLAVLYYSQHMSENPTNSITQLVPRGLSNPLGKGLQLRKKKGASPNTAFYPNYQNAPPAVACLGESTVVAYGIPVVSQFDGGRSVSVRTPLRPRLAISRR